MVRFLLCFALLGPFVAEVEWRFCVQFLVVPRGGVSICGFRGFDFWYFWRGFLLMRTEIPDLYRKGAALAMMAMMVLTVMWTPM